MQIILIYILWISFAIQIFFFVYFYFRVFLKNNEAQKETFDKPVSIIISAKNEADNLKKFLPKVLNQNYFKFELVIVDDMSDDGTSEILNLFSKKYKNLSIINIDKKSKKKGKKNALTEGIKKSKYEFLIFTDADCYPVSENWITSIMSSYKNETEIVLAYGGYEYSSGFLNKLIRYDTLSIALKYMSFAKAGIAYMGVGRNLSYKKSCFINNCGFENHKHIKSGDDDLFINETANKNNTEIVTNYESITKSIPKKTWKELIKQKQRHLTTGFKYKIIHKALFGVEIVSLLFFYISVITTIFLKNSIALPILLYLLRTVIQVFTILFFSKRFKEKINLIFIPIFDVLIPVVNLYAAVSNKFTNNKEWK